MNRRGFIRGIVTVGMVASLLKGRMLADYGWEDLGPGAPYSDIEITYPEGGEWGVVINCNGHSMDEVAQVVENMMLEGLRG